MTRSTPTIILVTGATGFIGSALVNRLLSDGCSVRALVLPDDPTTGLWTGSVQEVRGDISDASSVHKAMEGVSTVYHLAAVVADWADKDVVQRVTMDGTANVLEAALRQKTRVVLASSIIVYGDAINREECDEDHPFGRPLGVYSGSKQAQERLARDFAEAKGLELVVVRPANVIGPRCGPWVDEVVAQMRSHMPALLSGGGQNAGLVCIDNLVDVFVRAGQCPEAVGRIYNAADGGDVTWRQYFTDLSTLAGTPGPRSIPRWVASAMAGVCEPLWRGLRRRNRPPITFEALNLVGSHHTIPIGRAQRDLGYQPAADSYTRTMKAIGEYLQSEGGP